MTHMEEVSAESTIWRMHSATKLFAVASIGLLAVIMATELFLVDNDPLYATCVLLAAWLAVWRFYFYPYLSLGSGQLVVRNPLRTRRIPLINIVSVTPSWGGLDIALADDTMVRVWAIQKPSIARLFGRQARADRVTQEILRACRSSS